MEIKREFSDVTTDGKSLFQEARDVFIAESISMPGVDTQQLIDELETKVQEGFRGLTDERAASKMALLESLFDLWQTKYEEVQIVAEDQLTQKRFWRIWEETRSWRPKKLQQVQDIQVVRGNSKSKARGP